MSEEYFLKKKENILKIKILLDLVYNFFILKK